MSSHNICFHGEIRKNIIWSYACVLIFICCRILSLPTSWSHRWCLCLVHWMRLWPLVRWQSSPAQLVQRKHHRQVSPYQVPGKHNMQIRHYCNQKVLIFYLFLHENIHVCCAYSLEAPHWGTSNEYPNIKLSWRNKKNVDTPSYHELQHYCFLNQLIIFILENPYHTYPNRCIWQLSMSWTARWGANGSHACQSQYKG